MCEPCRNAACERLVGAAISHTSRVCALRSWPAGLVVRQQAQVSGWIAAAAHNSSTLTWQARVIRGSPFGSRASGFKQVSQCAAPGRPRIGPIPSSLAHSAPCQSCGPQQRPACTGCSWREGAPGLAHRTGAGSMQADLYNDLQDAGLLPFAESWGVISDVNRLLKGPEGLSKHNNDSHMGIPGLAGGSNQQRVPGGAAAGASSMQIEEDKYQVPAPSGNGHGAAHPEAGAAAALGCMPGIDDNSRLINEAAQTAVSNASRAVLQARQVMQEVTACTATRLTPMASSTQQSNGRSSGRKAGRGSAQQEQPGRGQTAAAGKGLRQFALMVCEQVRERGRTTYNEVADVLVSTLTACEEGVPDDKTIRRRVYDAINVLMATGVIEREKKNIIWKGLPTLDNAATGPANTGLQELKQARLKHISDVDRKQTFLQELVDQHASLDRLIQRNASQVQQHKGGTEIHLPFLLLQARLDATVEVQISDDMQDVTFDIDSAFQLHDDHDVVKQLAGASSSGAKPASPQAHSSMQQ